MTPLGLVLVSAVLATLLTTADAKRLVFKNRSPGTIWVGSQGNSGKPPVDGGGWVMEPGQEVKPVCPVFTPQITQEVDDSWAGRFWGRTGCGSDNHCQTGDCGNKLKCEGNGGAPPATLAEFTFNGNAGQDFYDVSNVDGYNIAVEISPIDKSGGGDKYRCNAATCPGDINGQCPEELRVVEGGTTVGCKSACLAFNTDQYCCRNAFNTPETCKSSTWPRDYPAFFKSQCPDAYSYAYDDQKSTYTCDASGYNIIFG